MPKKWEAVHLGRVLRNRHAALYRHLHHPSKTAVIRFLIVCDGTPRMVLATYSVPFIFSSVSMTTTQSACTRCITCLILFSGSETQPPV